MWLHGVPLNRRKRTKHSGEARQNLRDGIVVRASASLSVDLGFIP